MIITAKDYDSACQALKDAMTLTEIKHRMPNGDKILIFIDPKADKTTCEKSIFSQKPQSNKYKNIKKEPDMQAQLCNLLIALDELHRRRQYLFDNPTKDPIYIDLDGFFNGFRRDLTAYKIY